MIRSARIALVSVCVLAGLATASPALADPPSGVTAVGVATSTTSVYPHKDGYRDTVTIAVTPTTSDDGALGSTGVLSIAKGSKTVKTWSLSSAASASFVWTGLVKSKIVPGSYSITATFTNPDATTATATVPLVVSSRRLVEHHWSKKVAAGNVTDCGPGALCTYDLLREPAAHGKLGTGYSGVRYTGVESAGVENSTQSAVRLPSSVTGSIKARMHVSASVTLSGTKGHRFAMAGCADGEQDGCGDIGSFKSRGSSGSLASPTLTLDSGSPYATWLASEEVVGSHAVVGHYTVHVTYYKLN